MTLFGLGRAVACSSFLSLTSLVFWRRVRRRRLASALLAPCLLACASDEPAASPDAIARAERIYTQCVEDELGIEIERLHIGPNGDIDVVFAPGAGAEGEAVARRVCEPRIGSVLEPGGVSVLGPPPNLGRPGSDAELSALLEERRQLGFEGAIAIEFRGELRTLAGFGELAAGSGRAPDGDTAFDCGSIMKDMTRSVILLLEREGALAREQPLADFFPDLPAAWRQVTIEQTLEHSAGFDAYHDTEGDFEEQDRATALAIIFGKDPLFTPGSDVDYSNSGYTVLAALIEQVTGQDYRSAVRERIFAPLGMTRSGFYGEPRWQDGNVAIGRGADIHLDNDPSRWPPPTWALLGNGGLVSTVNDLLRWSKWFTASGGLVDSLLEQRPDAIEDAPTLGGKPVLALAGGNDFGFNAVVGAVLGDDTHIIVASHVLSPVTAEILGVEALQVVYGEVLEGIDD
jgi:CubicO group peptidase (beta-lactamase class C family)